MKANEIIYVDKGFYGKLVKDTEDDNQDPMIKKAKELDERCMHKITELDATLTIARLMNNDDFSDNRYNDVEYL